VFGKWVGAEGLSLSAVAVCKVCCKSVEEVCLWYHGLAALGGATLSEGVLQLKTYIER